MPRPRVVFKLLVGGEKPGIRPIRLAVRIKKKKLPNKGRYFRPFFPIMLSTKPTINSTKISTILRKLRPPSGTTALLARDSERRARKAIMIRRHVTNSAVNGGCGRGASMGD